MKAVIIGIKANTKNEESKTIDIFENVDDRNDFMKVVSIKNLIEYLIGLKKVEIKGNKCHVDHDTFSSYIVASELIDHYFGNLLEGYIGECDCDECKNNHDNVCPSDCTNSCENCDCQFCDSKSNDEEDEMIMDHAMLNDIFNLVGMFKPVFNLDNVKEDNEVNITMTGKEYLAIKEILDKYEFDEEDTDEEESSNT